jgi:hypothetical protein
LKVKIRFILLLASLVLVMILMIVFQLPSLQEQAFHKTVVNENIVQTKTFSVKSVSTSLNTSAKGTAEHIQIVASIEVDPSDWGGVAFYIPENWFISNITSSYPDNAIQSKPENYVSTWSTTEMENVMNTWIEIGRDRSYRPTGGGTGTVVIDLVPDKNIKDKSVTFEIGVEVGSDASGGRKVMGTDFIKVPISLNTM